MRVATYTRISTDEEHQPYSLEAQAQKLGSYSESQEGWALVRSFTDSMSGATLQRPGLEAALEAARAGRFDLLLVYRVDRLSRSVRGLAQVLEELDACGVAFRSATEPFDTAMAAGRMMVQMLGVFAEFERNADIGIPLEMPTPRLCRLGRLSPLMVRLWRSESRHNHRLSVRHEVARCEWTRRKEVDGCRLRSLRLVLDACPHPDVRCW